MLERQVIAGVAQRIGAFGDAIADALLVHGVAPGAIDDLSSEQFQQAAGPIYDLTLSKDFQTNLGAAFGWAATMVDRHGDAVTDECWQTLSDYLRHAAAILSPGWADADIERETLLDVASTLTPAVLRFDLLAALVQPGAALRLTNHARRCVAIVSTTSWTDHELEAPTLSSYLAELDVRKAIA